MNKLMYQMSFDEKAIEVTQSWIAKMYESNRKVELIRMARSLTGLGLKDAKDLVINAEFPNDSRYLFDKINEYISATEQLKNREIQEKEIQEKKIQEKIEREIHILLRNITLKMVVGIDISSKSFDALGCADPFDAAQMVIQRHKEMFINASDKIRNENCA